MERVYREHYAGVVRKIRADFGDRVDAEDVVSTALEEMVRAQRMVRYTPGAGAQLFRLAHLRAIDVTRASRPTVPANAYEDGGVSLLPEDPALHPAELAELAEEDAQVHELLTYLSGPERLYAYCTLVLGLSKRSAIMRRTGWSEDAFQRYRKRTQATLTGLVEQRLSGETCRRQQALMSWALDGHLSSRQMTTMRLHTAHCGVCRATLAVLRDQRRALGALAPWITIGTGTAKGGGLIGLVQGKLGGLLGGGGGGAAGAGAVTLGGAKSVAVVCGIGCVVGGAVVVEQTTGPPVTKKPAARTAAAAQAQRPIPSGTLRPVSLTDPSRRFPAAPAAAPRATSTQTQRPVAVKSKAVRKARLRSATSRSGRSASSAQVEHSFGVNSSAKTQTSSAAAPVVQPTPAPAASSSQVEQTFGVGSGSSSAPAPKPAAKPVTKNPTCYPGDLGC